MLSFTFIFAQTTIKVYDNNNGINNIRPTNIIEKKNDKEYYVYQTNNGIPKSNPSQIIEKKGNKITITETNNGIPKIIPKKTIIID